jgi:hypothetical protein
MAHPKPRKVLTMSRHLLTMSCNQSPKAALFPQVNVLPGLVACFVERTWNHLCVARCELWPHGASRFTCDELPVGPLRSMLVTCWRGAVLNHVRTRARPRRSAQGHTSTVRALPGRAAFRGSSQRAGFLVGLCRSSPGGVALVTGDAGSGKSRLLSEVATRAMAAGAEVLRGHAVPSSDSTGELTAGG